MYGKLTYYYAKLLSHPMIGTNAIKYRSYLSNHSIYHIRLLYKTKHAVVKSLEQTEHQISGLFGKSVYDFVQSHGKPLCLTHNRNGGVLHHALLYSGNIDGVHSRRVYHFINQQLAVVAIHYQADLQEQVKAIRENIRSRYSLERELCYKKEICLIDQHGHKMIFDQTSSPVVTYVNMDMNIEQNINAAFFNQHFAKLNLLPAGKIQFSS